MADPLLIARNATAQCHLLPQLANRHGLKTEEYGLLVMDKAKGSCKEVESWRYNERGVQAIGELLQAGD